MKPRRLFLYYLMFVVAMVTWTNVALAPPLPVRIAFLVAVLYPGLNDVRGLLVAALTCFWSIATYGYAYSYMPTMPYIYVFALTLALWMFWDRHRSITSRLLGGENSMPFFFLIYVWLSDAYTESSLGNTAYILLTMTMLTPFVPVVNRRTVTYFSLSFMTVTIVLSYYLIITRDLFTYGAAAFTTDLDRPGWTDQNYLGLVIGMGASVAITCMMKSKLYRWYFIALCIVTFSISIPVLLMLASRTALMALVASVVIQLMFSKWKKKYKFVLILAAAAFLYYLYANEYFDLVEKRIEADDGSGSNRMYIWEKKIHGFFANDSLVELIFGVGKDRGIGISTILGLNNVGFHNDFLAFFVCYGLVGLGFFTCMLFRPLFKARRHTPYFTAVYANFFYLLIGSLLIEPFSMDMYPFYAFLFYTMLLTKIKVLEK